MTTPEASGTEIENVHDIEQLKSQFIEYSENYLERDETQKELIVQSVLRLRDNVILDNGMMIDIQAARYYGSNITFPNVPTPTTEQAKDITWFKAAELRDYTREDQKYSQIALHFEINFDKNSMSVCEKKYSYSVPMGAVKEGGELVEDLFDPRDLKVYKSNESGYFERKKDLSEWLFAKLEEDTTIVNQQTWDELYFRREEPESEYLTDVSRYVLLEQGSTPLNEFAPQLRYETMFIHNEDDSATYTHLFLDGENLRLIRVKSNSDELVEISDVALIAKYVNKLAA